MNYEFGQQFKKFNFAHNRYHVKGLIKVKKAFCVQSSVQELFSSQSKRCSMVTKHHIFLYLDNYYKTNLIMEYIEQCLQSLPRSLLLKYFLFDLTILR